MFILLLDRDTVGSSYNYSSRHPAKEAMINHTAHILEFLSHLGGVLDWFCKMKIDNVVTVIGNGNLITIDLIVRGGSHTQQRLAARTRGKSGNRAHSVRMAKGSNLHRNRKSRSKTIAKFGFVHCIV